MSESSEFIRRGEHLLEIKRPGEAIREFERALAISPEDPIVLSYLALAYLSLNKPDKTLDYAARAIAAEPNNDWPFRIKAHAHLQKDQKKSAYQAAARAVQLDPENTQSLTMLGDCALGLQRLEEVRVLGELVRRQAPDSTYGHHLLGSLAEVEEKTAEAAAHFEKVLELEPTNADALDSLARLRNRHNKFGESVSLLRGALSVDPTEGRRRSAFSESMKRFALFGEAHERRKSVAGLMVSIFIGYLVISIVALNQIGNENWLVQTIMFGLCGIMLLAIPFLRARFFASQATQLQLLQQNLSRMQRRRTIAATAVIVVVAYGIAGLVYLENRDSAVFFAPLAFAITAFWVYMFAITLRLASLWMSDTWTRMMGKDVPEDDRGLPVSMIALPVISIVALAVGFWNDHSAAWLLFFAGTTITAVVYFRRYPTATSVTTIVLGVVILVLDLFVQLRSDDLTLGEVGILVAGIGAAGLALRGLKEVQKYWQRRRLGKLLARRRSPA